MLHQRCSCCFLPNALHCAHHVIKFALQPSSCVEIVLQPRYLLQLHELEEGLNCCLPCTLVDGKGQSATAIDYLMGVDAESDDLPAAQRCARLQCRSPMPTSTAPLTPTGTFPSIWGDHRHHLSFTHRLPNTVYPCYRYPFPHPTKKQVGRHS